MRVSFDGVEIVKKFLNFIFLFGEVSFKFEQGCVPKSTVKHFTVSKLPFL